MWIVNLAGVLLIALIVWWFWLYQPNAEVGAGELIITVDNGTYSPSHIRLPPGQATVLKFLRKDPSPCAETLLIPALQFSDTLPLNKVKSIPLPALTAGNYDFHCQMQMYRGQISVSGQAD